MLTDDERHAVMAHPFKFLEMALKVAPAQIAVDLGTKDEAKQFYLRVLASNKAKRFIPHNIWCTRFECWVYAKALKV